MTYVFWQNIPSPHQAPWISALAKRSGVPVRMIVQEDIPESRRKLGWSNPDYRPAILEVGISNEKILRIIKEAGPDAVHVFTGIKAYRDVQKALVQCAKTGGLRMGLMSECPRRGGLGGAARFVWQKLNFIRFGRHLDFVLGLGEHAGRRFVHLGYQRKRLFDFAYYPPLPAADEVSASEVWPADRIRLLHLGDLTFGKGIDRVIRALGAVGGSDWFYALVGYGPQEEPLSTLARSLAIDSRIAFWGAMPYRKAMTVLASSDVLILASRMDGYGAVINEALFRGVPVICSSDCGACQVIRMDPALGTIFTSHANLCDALRYWLGQGARTAERSARIRNLSNCVSPESGADYFLEIMQHVYHGASRPTSPWQRA